MARLLVYVVALISGRPKPTDIVFPWAPNIPTAFAPFTSPPRELSYRWVSGVGFTRFPRVAKRVSGRLQEVIKRISCAKGPKGRATPKNEARIASFPLVFTRFLRGLHRFEDQRIPVFVKALTQGPILQGAHKGQLKALLVP